mgnify:CR=1 FL=1
MRQDFPVLAGDDPPVYLDNACMPMKPEPVLAAMDDYYRNFPTCGGRSLHKLAFDVTEHYETRPLYTSDAAADTLRFSPRRRPLH